MKNDRSRFVTKLMQDLFALWQSTIENGGCISNFFFPISGYDYRIDDFLAWQAENKHPTSQVLDLNLHTMADIEDVVIFFRNNDNSIIIKPANKLLYPTHHQIFSTILEHSRINGKGMIFLFEAFPSQFSQEDIVRFRRAFQSFKIIPMLSKDDTNMFVEYLENKWNKKCSVNRDALYRQTGGHTWLTKEIVRQNVREGNDLDAILKSKVYLFKVLTIKKCIPQQHLAKLLSYSSQGVNSEDEEIQELKDMGMINPKIKGHLPEFIKRFDSEPHELHLREGRILFRDIDISNTFSPQESILLQLLIQAKGNIITRESLSSSIWPNGSYSDWSFDQLVLRVRRKLVKNGVVSQKINTYRGKGIRLSIHGENE